MACNSPWNWHRSTWAVSLIWFVLSRFDPELSAHLMVSRTDSVPFLYEGMLDAGFTVFTLFNAGLEKSYPVPEVVANNELVVLGRHQPSWVSPHAGIDLCSGFGGRSQGSEAAGFYITVAVDENGLRLDPHDPVHAAHCLCGDNGDCTMIQEIWSPSRGASVVSGGSSFRPFSRLGDCKGQIDTRACCLTQSSNAALYLIDACVTLDCAALAAHDSFALADLDRFCKVTGFHCTQIELLCDHVWACRRYCSWWVLSWPGGGNVHLRPRPTLINICAVQQILVADLLACAPCAYGRAILQDLYRSTTLVGHEQRGISVQRLALTFQALSLVYWVAWIFRGLAVCRIASSRCFVSVSQLGFCNFWEVTNTPRCCFPGVLWPMCRLHCIVRRFSTVGGDSSFQCCPLVVGRFLAFPLVGLWCTQDGSRPLNVTRAANWDKLVVWNMNFFPFSWEFSSSQLTNSYFSQG